MTRIEIFFSNLFPKLILRKKLVATVLYVISKHVTNFKTKMDLTLNTDI